MKATLRMTAVCVVALANVAATAQDVIYVKADAAGKNDGTTWADAFVSLQDALAASDAGDEIWVAAGTYRPDLGANQTPGERGHAFELKSGVRVLGGFAGSEQSKGGRDRAANVSVLSGDLAGDDDGFARREDNSYHVVRAVGVDDDTLLEGFMIVGGSADGAGADSLGGGIYIDGGAPWVINVRVNSSDAGCGGGVAVVGSATPTFVNVVLNGNRARRGGGMCSMDADPQIINATVTANLADFGAGIYNADSSPSIVNTIVSGNRTIASSGFCEVWQHPCSVADVPPDVLDRDDEILDGATEALLNGTIEDAVNYVTSQPDVVQVLTDSLAVGWRIAGGALSTVIDGTGLPVDVFALGKRGEGSGKIAEALATKRSGSVASLTTRKTTPGRSIVGEDWNGDGEINNRDGKRALVLSPFGFPDAEYANTVISEAPGYTGGNTVFLDPWTMRSDILFNSWRIWDEFDFIYVATFVQGLCEGPPSSECGYGFVTNQGSRNVAHTITGRMVVNDPFTLDNVAVEVSVLSPRFFEDNYAGLLDNVMFYCTLCFMDDLGGSLYAAIAAESSSFAGLWWFRSLRSDSSEIGLEAANTVVTSALALGAPNPEPVTPAGGLLELPDRARTRIIELPVLMLESKDGVVGPMTELADISDMVIGTIGDEEPDQLVLREFVYGVASEVDEEEFALRFEIGGIEVPETYRLGTSATPTEAGYVWDFREIVDLGHPVESGILPMKAIVQLPDGTESTYVVNATVDAFSCSGKVSFDGYQSGVFNGAAQWSVTEDSSSATVTIESTTAILAQGPEPDLGLTVSDYHLLFLGEPVFGDSLDGYKVTMDNPIVTLTRRHTVNGWAAVNQSRCDDCFGRLVAYADTTIPGILTGEFEFAVNDLTDGPANNPFVTTGSGEFRAASGGFLDLSSPYGKCVDEYWTAYELATGG